MDRSRLKPSIDSSWQKFEKKDKMLTMTNLATVFLILSLTLEGLQAC